MESHVSLQKWHVLFNHQLTETFNFCQISYFVFPGVILPHGLTQHLKMSFKIRSSEKIEMISTNAQLKSEIRLSDQSRSSRVNKQKFFLKKSYKHSITLCLSKYINCMQPVIFHVFAKPKLHLSLETKPLFFYFQTCSASFSLIFLSKAFLHEYHIA